MKIKVCGLKYPENIKAVADLQPDLTGFIFYKPSPRYVGELDHVSLSEIPSNIIKTGVFVNETIENIGMLIQQYRLGAVQLHGSESPEFCLHFKGRVKVLKAFGVDESFDFGILDEYKDVVDFFLFDAKTPIHGGSGKNFDWQLVDNYKLNIPFFLSGGISSENIGEVIRISHPQFYGVDLNSRFEIEPGLKDINKLEKAFELINKTTDEIRG